MSRNKCEKCIYFPKCAECPSDKSGCNDYKNSSRFIELPCAVGGTVYFLDGKMGKVTSFYHCENPNAGNMWISVEKQRYYPNNTKRVNVCLAEFGKTVFANRAEAEVALSKMKGGAENA